VIIIHEEKLKDFLLHIKVDRIKVNQIIREIEKYDKLTKNQTELRNQIDKKKSYIKNLFDNLKEKRKFDEVDWEHLRRLTRDRFFY